MYRNIYKLNEIINTLQHCHLCLQQKYKHRERTQSHLLKFKYHNKPMLECHSKKIKFN